MKKSLVICLIGITVLPLTVISWLGVSRIKGQEDQLKRQSEVLLKNNLENAVQRVQNTLLKIENQLIQQLPSSPPTQEILQRLSRKHALVSQAFYMDSKGKLVYPDTGQQLSQREIKFLQRTSLLWENDAILEGQEGKESAGLERLSKERSGKSAHGLLALAERHNQGWIPWYWEDGLHLLFWKAVSGGGVIGVEVEYMALLSRVTASLPEGESSLGKYVLCNAGGEFIYQWGRFSPEEEKALFQSHQLPAPLHSWQIRYYGKGMSLTQEGGWGELAGQWIVLAMLLLTLIGLSVYFFRESSRSFYEAEHRVQFVNRVSHELKTPLTNIRLYAELLEDKLSEEDKTAVKQLSIIQAETQRLTRLISNILTFSKQAKSTLKLRPEEICVDDVIKTTMESCKPSLEKLGVLIELDLNAPVLVSLDRDAGGQILYNLISNVEKYARSGGSIKITSGQTRNETRIQVIDKGPGIPLNQVQKIFNPYYRVSSKVTEGISGTGIGLSISRDLARIQGGELELVKSPEGCIFQWTIPHKG
ncbi:MAG: HAMP domain-containing histidine kinase [Fibrobacteria bacterium]|nr:HAMP domain-containing histidine kinase [Fibrobacteria bacterium]